MSLTADEKWQAEKMLNPIFINDQERERVEAILRQGPPRTEEEIEEGHRKWAEIKKRYNLD